MIKLDFNFLPIRIVIEEQKPITLNIFIESDRKFDGYLEIRTPPLVGFDRLCLQRILTKDLKLNENEKKIFQIPIYVKDRILPGIYPIKIKIYDSNEKIEKIADLRVISKSV